MPASGTGGLIDGQLRGGKASSMSAQYSLLSTTNDSRLRVYDLDNFAMVGLLIVRVREWHAYPHTTTDILTSLVCTGTVMVSWLVSTMAFGLSAEVPP